ncbi:MAG: fibronectin type III domain-containing protein [Clostridia bacterium]|nr:fibronectin type III domain-containing protein [Clostridia bacterium]
MRKIILIFLTFVLSATIAFAVEPTAGFTTDYSKDGKFYHNEMFDNAIVVQGVDLSTWQNQISVSTFKKMKAQGVDFVILRLGYTGSGNFKAQLDDCFEVNYANAKEAGMEVGVYYYSLATMKMKPEHPNDPRKQQSAQEEAQFVLEHIKDKDITYPIFLDVEDPNHMASRSKVQLANICNTFCSIIKEANEEYVPGVYASLSWFNNKIGDIDPSYVKWVAQYNYRCQYEGEYIMWQYGSTGKVEGFEKRLDVNYRYIDDSVSSGNYSLSKADVTLSYEETNYSGSQKKPEVTVRLKGKALTPETDYHLAYYTNVKAGTAYAVITGKGKYTDTKITPFVINPTPLDGYEIRDIADVTYSGKSKVPTVKVHKIGKETNIASSNYKVSYKNNVNAGTATVTVKGKGNYTGTLEKTFKIKKLAPTITASDATKRGSITFSLKAQTNSDGKLKYASSDETVATVSEDGKVTTKGFGSCQITITSPSTKNCKKASVDVTVTVTGIVNGLEATNIKDTSCTLSWDKLKMAKKYSVYRYNPETGKYKLLKTTTATSYTMEDLTMNTQYKVYIKAKDEKGSYGKKCETLLLTTLLPTIKNFKATEIVADGATLTWKKVAGVSQYQVLKLNPKTKLYANYKKVKTNSLQVSGLEPNTQYSFKVRCLADDVKGPLTKLTFTTGQIKPVIKQVKVVDGILQVEIEDGNIKDFEIMFADNEKFTASVKKVVKAKNNKISIDEPEWDVTYIKVRSFVKGEDGAVYSKWSKVKKYEKPLE